MGLEKKVRFPKTYLEQQIEVVGEQRTTTLVSMCFSIVTLTFRFDMTKSHITGKSTVNGIISQSRCYLEAE